MDIQEGKQPIIADHTTDTLQYGDIFVLPKVPELNGKVFHAIEGDCENCCFFDDDLMCNSAPCCAAFSASRLIFKEI